MAGESYNEHRENSTDVIKIDEVIRTAKLDEEKLYSSILWWKTDAINNFYKIEWNETVFDLNHVRDYLYDVYQRLSWMKVQKFWEVSKEKNFTWTILAIQIVLKAMKTNPINPKEYNIWQINWEYDETTKAAIKQFQTDCKLKWKDGKPWRETIWKIVKDLDNYLKNKKLEKEWQEKLRNDIKKLIEESFRDNPNSWILYNELTVDSMTDYIIKWKLWSKDNEELEDEITTLSRGFFNQKLQYLINHPKMPIAQALKLAEEEQRKRNNSTRNLTTNLTSWWTNRNNSWSTEKQIEFSWDIETWPTEIIKDWPLSLCKINPRDTTETIRHRVAKIDEFSYLNQKKYKPGRSWRSVIWFNIENKFLKPWNYIQIPIEMEKRQIDDQKFYDYCKESIRRITSGNNKYSTRIKNLISKLWKWAERKLALIMTAFAKKETANTPSVKIWTWWLYRYESANCYSISYFHILMKWAWKRARDNLWFTDWDTYNPVNAWMLFLAFRCENDSDDWMKKKNLNLENCLNPNNGNWANNCTKIYNSWAWRSYSDGLKANYNHVRNTTH